MRKIRPLSVVNVFSQFCMSFDFVFSGGFAMQKSYLYIVKFIRLSFCYIWILKNLPRSSFWGVGQRGIED